MSIVMSFYKIMLEDGMESRGDVKNVTRAHKCLCSHCEGKVLCK